MRLTLTEARSKIFTRDLRETWERFVEVLRQGRRAVQLGCKDESLKGVVVEDDDMPRFFGR